jgi:hypothetical protein
MVVNSGCRAGEEGSVGVECALRLGFRLGCVDATIRSLSPCLTLQTDARDQWHALVLIANGERSDDVDVCPRPRARRSPARRHDSIAPDVTQHHISGLIPLTTLTYFRGRRIGSGCCEFLVDF